MIQMHSHWPKKKKLSRSETSHKISSKASLQISCSGPVAFFFCLDLCLPTTKNSDACGGLRLRRASILSTKTPPYKARASFLLFLFLFLSFFFFLPLRPSLLPLLALLCLLSLIFALSLTHDLSQELRQVSPFGTRRRTISIGIPQCWTLLDCS